MREALGLVEVIGLSNAILAADSMSKTANINIIGLENSRGLGYMTIKITGDVGAVTAAVTCGKQISIENNSFVTSKVIPRPSNNIEATFCQLESEKNKVSIESASVEKENNEERVISTENSVDIENESSNNIIAEKETIAEVVVQEDSTSAKDTAPQIKQDRVKEVLIESDNKAKEVEASSAKPSSPKDEASNTEKEKTKNTRRKKTEPKNN
jgi:microcompartment protein CcmL/EutN